MGLFAEEYRTQMMLLLHYIEYISTDEFTAQGLSPCFFYVLWVRSITSVSSFIATAHFCKHYCDYEKAVPTFCSTKGCNDNFPEALRSACDLHKIQHVYMGFHLR